ncbi:MAG: hypothetical protein GY940_43620, partial [bacterium]|nr:hypothetical protein [bacterium]
KLPAYMIPAYFVSLDMIPLKSSGKVDREALAARGTPLGTGTEYVPPKTLTEQSIGDIWREVLNIDKVSVDENFFDLGGNSLKIVELGNRLKEVLRQDISVMRLFEHATIRSMANYIDRQKNARETDFENVEIDRTQIIINARQTRKEIAVIGMAGRFPGAGNIDEFWFNLKNGIESISFTTESELEAAGCDRELYSQPGYVKTLGGV